MPPVVTIYTGKFCKWTNTSNIVSNFKFKTALVSYVIHPSYTPEKMLFVFLLGKYSQSAMSSYQIGQICERRGGGSSLDEWRRADPTSMDERHGGGSKFG